MQANKPYLWLSGPASDPYLSIIVNWTLNQNTFTGPVVTTPSPADGLILTYTQDNNATNPISTNPIRLSTLNPGYVNGTHLWVKVVLMNGNTLVGSCQLRIGAMSGANDIIKPYVWLGPNEIHYTVQGAAPNKNITQGSSSGSSTKTIASSQVNSTNYNDSDNWQNGATSFDPGVTSVLRLQIDDGTPQKNRVGGTTSTTSDADASGGGYDVLQAFFD